LQQKVIFNVTFIILAGIILVLTIALACVLKALVPECHKGARVAISIILALIIFWVAVCRLLRGFGAPAFIAEPPIVLGLMLMFAIAIIWRLTRSGR